MGIFKIKTVCNFYAMYSLKILLYTEKLQIQGTEGCLIFRKGKLEPEVINKVEEPRNTATYHRVQKT
jgi:hypothetical protein